MKLYFFLHTQFYNKILISDSYIHRVSKKMYISFLNKSKIFCRNDKSYEARPSPTKKKTLLHSIITLAIVQEDSTAYF